MDQWKMCVFSDVSLLCRGEEEVIQVFFLNKTIRVYYSKLHCVYQEARCHMLLQHNMDFLALPAEMTSLLYAPRSAKTVHHSPSLRPRSVKFC